MAASLPWLNESGSDELLNGIFNRGYVLPVVMQKGKLDIGLFALDANSDSPKIFS
jgi:hypothetical protein